MEFLSDPEKYAAKISRPESGKNTSGAIKCSVCGEQVSEEVAVRQEYREEQSDEKYYFCSEKHRIEFITDPMTYKGLSGKHVSP
jgi:YHS domain-containing protein